MTKTVPARRPRKRADYLAPLFRYFCAALLTLGASTSAAQSATSPGPENDPAFIDAVWIATQSGPMKLPKRGADEPVLLQDQTRPLAVAIDEIGGRVWFYDSRILRGYDFSGRPLLTVDINPIVADNAHLNIAVDPTRKQLFIAQHKTLYRVATDGAVFGRHSESSTIDKISLDRKSGTLFLAMQQTIRVYTADLRFLAGFSAPESIVDIDFDPQTGELWLATKNSVLRVSAAGIQTVSIPFSGADQIAADGTGAVWVLRKKALSRIDASGLTLLESNLTTAQGEINLLGADTNDHALWLATNKQLLYVSKDGAVGTPIATGAAIHDFAIYTDSFAPTID